MSKRTSHPRYSLPVGKMKKGVLLKSEPLFWMAYQRESDKQSFIEELTQEEVLERLEAGGIKLVCLEAALDEKGRWRNREVRL